MERARMGLTKANLWVHPYALLEPAGEDVRSDFTWQVRDLERGAALAAFGRALDQGADHPDVQLGRCGAVEDEMNVVACERLAKARAQVIPGLARDRETNLESNTPFGSSSGAHG